MHDKKCASPTDAKSAENCLRENDMLKDFFENEKIEYYAVLDYRDCIEISESIIGRENFTPRSVILFLLPYYTSETVNLSRYAASLDYHIAIREVGERLKEYLSLKFPDAKMKIFGDHSPIAERHAALIAGLGIAGDSGLLINEKYGTYTFIGDMITDIPPHILGASSPLPIRSCSRCGACKRACPTGILRGEGNDCLSAITQKKGELSQDECRLMIKYGTVWGCDICQTACPHNRNPKKTPLEFFYRERLIELKRSDIDAMSGAEFKRRAFAWRGKSTVLRNIGILEGAETSVPSTDRVKKESTEK